VRPPAAATLAAALLAAAALGHGAAAAGGASAQAARAPVVSELIAFPDGSAVERRAAARGLLVRVGRRRCAVGTGTPLAALLRARPGRVLLRDFGACSRRASDAGGIFVEAVRGWRNRRLDGWVYKVGRRGGSAGAADPSGPFGSGRLRRGQRVLWFYCRAAAGGCQRTLALRFQREPGGALVRVTGYDNDGRGARVAGAEVRVGRVVRALTGPDGTARLELPRGRYRVQARKQGLVRSFTETLVVR
jgi:hypothetical protein